MENIRKSCQVFGKQISYIRKGQGETMLLVHGITTWSFIFRKIFDQLSTRFDVIAIDLLGCGYSEKTVEVDLSLKNHAQLIHTFLNELGVKKIHYVGHDLGGGIGQIFSVQFPHRVYDLVVINTVAYDFWPVQPIITMRTPIIRQLAMATLDLGIFKLIVKRGLYHKSGLTPELMELFWMPMKTKEGRKSFLHFAHCLDNKNLVEIQEKLREIKFPVLIVRGDGDIYLSASIAEKLHQEIPGSNLIRIDSAGHFLMEDEPDWLLNQMFQFYFKT